MNNQKSAHCLLHVTYEGIGCIENWLIANSFNITYTHLYKNELLPDIEDIHFLIIMGGPMSVYETDKYSWISDEMSFMRKAIDMGKPVLGICLGSQLLAAVLGAKVYPNKHKEIGWYDIYKTETGEKSLLLKGFPKQVPVFHWHGDTFDLPELCEQLFYSEYTENQAFQYKTNVLGLQFHLESTEETLAIMIKEGWAEIKEEIGIQSADEIKQKKMLTCNTNNLMFLILDQLVKM